MPSRLSRADARLLWGAAILILLFGGLAVLVGPELRDEESMLPSSYSGDTGGALAAYLLLNDLGFDVRRWIEPPQQLPQDPSNAVLILASPTEGPTLSERAAVTRFVAAGGRVLFCGVNADLFLSETDAKSWAGPWARHDAVVPGPLTAGAPSIEVRPVARWDLLQAPQVALYGSTENPIAVTWTTGKGEILWWAGASPLTNVGLKRANNLRFFLNAMSNADGTKRAVYWDEYYHGERGSLWSTVERTPVKWGLVQLGIAMLAIVFGYSRRSGPIVEPAPVSRQSPLEFIDTMGGLYRRSSAVSIPVETAYRLLRLRLAQRLALPVSSTDAQLAAAANERLNIDQTELAAALDRARGPAPIRKEALGLVQTLMRYTLQLKENR